MATIKSFSDLQQSKKLAEILPLESADMYWWYSGKRYYVESMDDDDFNEKGDIRAWSLAALIAALPKIVNNKTLFIETSAALWHIGYRNIYIARAGNLMDACYELILKLNELKML